MSAKIYLTPYYETWDEIAYKVYGNETFAARLRSYNKRQRKLWQLPPGTIIELPDVVLPAIVEDLPKWRA